jgi:hypothetical protein
MAAAGWQQHRIPAFGDWNYNYLRDDDWPAVTPCFDFASAMRTTAARPAAQQKSNKVRYSRSTTYHARGHNGFQKIVFEYFSSCTANYTLEFLRQTRED